jgi:hypothetical protein
MTQHKAFKQRVRTRMSRTGERYTTARSQVLAKETPPLPEPMLPPEPAPPPEPTLATEPAMPADPTLSPEPALAAVPVSPFRGGYNASDDVLIRRTGHGWEHWYRLLEGRGAAERPHAEIARRLNVDHGVDGWWAQELTVRYEMAIGRRLPGQRPDGFEATASKTFSVPNERLYRAIVQEAERSSWLDRPLRLRVAKPFKSIRFDWDEGGQRIVFWIEAKGDRSSVAVAHQRLPDKAMADEMKVFWRDALRALAMHLERSR